MERGSQIVVSGLLSAILAWGLIGQAHADTRGDTRVQARWEAAVIFLGANQDGDFQRDIDQNMLELARLTPNGRFKLSLYREFQARSVSYFVDPESPHDSVWDPLFFETAPVHGIRVPGELKTEPRGAAPDGGIFRSGALLKRFLGKSFTDPASKRLLVIYGHGAGVDGLRDVRLQDLKRRLQEALPRRSGAPLDILWLDACFMANVEVAYELRSLSRLFVASQDAEFSAGAPFDSLNSLAEGPGSAETVALELAQRFIESYSYARKGSQRHAIESSSATISVIASDRLERWVRRIGEMVRAIGTLSLEIRDSLEHTAGRREMEKPELVDLGSFLLALKRQERISAEAKARIDGVLNSMELGQPVRLRTNPRIHVHPAQPNQWLVFGYDGWSRGFEKDTSTLSKLPERMKPGRFLAGPGGKLWPAVTIRNWAYLSPFSAGLSQFHYYLVDPVSGARISSEETYVRTSDFVSFTAGSSENPVLFSGYTQGIGSSAERYSGLSALDPIEDDASLEYLDTEFAAATGWTQL